MYWSFRGGLRGGRAYSGMRTLCPSCAQNHDIMRLVGCLVPLAIVSALFYSLGCFGWLWDSARAAFG